MRRPTSKTFATNFSLVLTAVTLLLLVSLSIFTAPPQSTTPTQNHQNRRWLDQQGDDDSSQNTDTDYTSYSCGALNEIVPDANDAQCQFAKTCNQGQGVWAPIVYCTSHRTLLLGVLSPFMLLWLVLLFRLLGSTAEDFFSPALEMLSHQFGLPPRFAGVSLLALGNGAADVSATVSAMTSDPKHGYKLSLGALSGAAMFISGVIAAAVIVTAQGVPCRGALVRDVLALVVTVVVVWTELKKGSIGSEGITMFMTLYAVFVLLVLAADVYHRAVVIPRLAAAARTAEEQRQLEAGATAAGDTAVAAPQKGGGRISHMLTALSNYDNVGAEEAAVESDDLLQDRPIQLHGEGGLLSRPHQHQQPPSPQSVADPATMEQHNYALLESSSPQSLCVGQNGTVATSWREAWIVGRTELYQHAEQTYDDIAYDGDLNRIQKFLLFCELPFTIFRQITVPVPCDGYYCRALVALSLALSPLWLAHYASGTFGLNILHNWWILLLIQLAVLVAAGALLRWAPGGDRAKLALPIATPLALYGFVVAATWIDTIAEALVSLLNFIGLLLRIPGPILGLTILAWGNSMGDLSANITMARKGLANMAMTACFAGPVFNILMGLGMGFSSLAAAGNAMDSIELSPSVETGFVFLLLNAVLLLGVGFTVGRIPKHFGYAALALYVVYLLTSIAVQYSKTNV